MDIYLIRHGETTANRHHYHQTPETPLDETGRAQAAQLSTFASSLKSTLFITSPFKRARETAAILESSIGTVARVEELFAELRRPRSIRGRQHFSFFSVTYMLRWFFSLNDSKTKDDRGETYQEFIDRLEQARIWLENQPTNTRAIIITHAIFITFLVDHLRHRRPPTFLRLFLLFLRVAFIKNGSVTHLRFDSVTADKTASWQILAFGATPPSTNKPPTENNQ